MRWNSRSNKFTILLSLIAVLNFSVLGSQAKLNLCDVETGQTNIILDIEESRGDRKYRSLCPNLPSDYIKLLIEQVANWVLSELRA